MNNEFKFVEISEEDQLLVNKGYWKIMIVDDDQEVHTITKMVLSDFTFDNKGVEFVSVYSQKEAIEYMSNNRDVALIFLDVVMEEGDSGLKVAKFIREELNNYLVRIVLRTGEPGQAPEEQVIYEYDINDYKEKTELTARKLFTTTITSIRSYRDLVRIDKNRKGLEKIIASSSDISKFKSMQEFISGVLMQLISIIEAGESAIYFQLPCFAAKKENGKFYIIAAVGEYENYVNKEISTIDDSILKRKIEDVIENKESNYYDENIYLYFKTQYSSEHIIYLKSHKDVDVYDKELLEVFIGNVAVAYDNIYLNKEHEEAQREIIFALGELTEARSQESGKHVKRVAEYCKCLAIACGLSEEEAEHIYIATSMHDVGKVAIPDSILNKPAKLSIEEFDVIKNHTSIGYRMLKKSNRPIMQLASIIAKEHHERYDGTGYPIGLKGEEIHIAGRIAAIADVFDALATERVYKKPWELEDVLKYMKEERGKHFDPRLIDIMFENVDEFIRIKNEYKD